MTKSLEKLAANEAHKLLQETVAPLSEIEHTLQKQIKELVNVYDAIDERDSLTDIKMVKDKISTAFDLLGNAESQTIKVLEKLNSLNEWLIALKKQD